jgi:hypothetical protein
MSPDDIVMLRRRCSGTAESVSQGVVRRPGSTVIPTNERDRKKKPCGNAAGR